MSNVVEMPQNVEEVEQESKLVVDRNYFTELQKINVSKYTKKKGKFTYLSWTQAVAQLKMKHPDAQINVVRFPETDEQGNMRMVPYMKTETGYFVEVEVIVNGVAVSEPYPVTDNFNKPIKNPDARAINDSIQRAKVKSIAGHGLGIYIFMGDEYPTDEADDANPPEKPQAAKTTQAANPSQNNNKPAGITKEQGAKINDLITQMAALRLDNPEDAEARKKKIGEITKHYKISGQETTEQATALIESMKVDLVTISNARTKKQEPAKQTVPAEDDSWLTEVSAEDVGELF